ncbi:thiamine pyrophosphokinase 1 [Penicillium rolfsii]|nr:thiamine pyrophosphokinase 1 [Penicillium rolfsii]
MEWDPSRFFRPEGSPSPYALLVLNQPINEKAFGVLSEHGDLDSILSPVRKHYEELGVSVVQDPDQYSTDFTKCLKYLNSHAAEIITSPRHQKRGLNTSSSHSALEVVILGGLGGRVDQAFSQIHHLYMMTQTQRQLRETQEPNGSAKLGSGAGGNLYLISEESITFVLQEGKNIIYTPATNRPDTDPSVDQDSTVAEIEYFFEENIGIIPLSAPASITTQGFEWDVKNWHTEIGGQLSTSNHIRADKVEVLTSVSVLFTVELAQRLKRA